MNGPKWAKLLFLLALQFWTEATAGPRLPELPLGTGAAAFAGGGGAHASGLNSVFTNPAALSIRDEMQAEMGLMGMAAGISPYFLFGSRAVEKSSYAIGLFHDARPGNPEATTQPRQGMIAGVSWEAFPWAVFGASVRSVGTGEGWGIDGFGIDEDLGALFRPYSALWLGLSVRNLQESGIAALSKSDSDGYATVRKYSVALGTGLSSLRLAGVEFNRPDAYYEIHSSGLPPAGRVSHAFSMASNFTPGGKLGLRGTFMLPHGGAPGFALGTFLNLPMGRAAIIAGYTFHAGGFEETGEVGASHSLSLNFRLGSKLDPLPPTVSVRADKSLLRLGDTGSLALVHFNLSASDETYVPGFIDGEEKSPKKSGRFWAGRRASIDESRSLAQGRIKQWSLILCAVGANGMAGAEVKSFHGKDLPPRVIRWDASDQGNIPVPPGFYAFRLEALDLADNQGQTIWQLIEIRAADKGYLP